MSRQAGGWRIVAPGKLILMGEYAVLEGAPGVVMAVDRHARVERLERESTDLPDSSDLTSIARRETMAWLGLHLKTGVFRSDSDELRRGDVKLGLGSSAAVTVGAVASVFHEIGEDIGSESTRRRMWEPAREIHNRFQGSRGSGLDVSASLFGGVTCMRRHRIGSSPDLHPWELPRGLRLAHVWTGRPASSPELVGKVSRFASHDPVGYGQLMNEMSGLAERFVEAGRTDPSVVLESFDRYAALLGELGRRSGAGIVTDDMAEVMSAAREAGGAAKPSGAGGGDFLVAAFSGTGDLEHFKRVATGRGMIPMDFRIASVGVHIEGTADHGDASNER